MNGSIRNSKDNNKTQSSSTSYQPYTSQPDATTTNRGPVARMGPGSSPEKDRGLPQPPIDPISRQILERTQSGRIPHVLHPISSHANSGASDDQPVRQVSDPVTVRRADSIPQSKVTKDKKKGVSFLSRIMGSKKREDSHESHDNASEGSENRSTTNDADSFSQPVGFIPRFPGPQRYVKVKAINRKEKEFDKLFVAQTLAEGEERNRKSSIDSRIHSISDTPQTLPNGSRSPSRAIWAMEISKDGRYLAAAGQDKKLRVWELIASVEDREGEIKADSSDDGDDMKLNAPVFKQKLVREYDGHTSSILDLSWSKNNFLLSSSMDKTVRLYHISRTECLCAFKHNDFVTSIQFHPRDDRFFLAGSLDSKIRLWSIPDKNVAFWQQVPDMVTAVAFTPDGKTAIAGCLNGLCILYDTEGLKAHSQIQVKSARGRNSKGSKVTGIDTIAIPGPHGQQDVKLLITSNDSRIRMYNLKDRMLEIKFRGNENSCSQIRATFSDDGKYVICGSEDRKVYIWPIGPTDKLEVDKRPVEVFEAHSAIVTTTLLAPTKTRRLLAQSGDPIYDLCNPPPVTLVSRAESVYSSKAPTNRSGQSEEKDPNSSPRKSGSPKRAPESPEYLARQSHLGGHIIVSADYTGQIKVFRHDCAFQKRRQESWDAGSTFSKKMLGRSGSTRNSVSSNKRTSVSLSSKNPSQDHILNWRNSITTTENSARNSASDVNLRNSLGDESNTNGSPSKSWTKRLSLKRPSTSLASQSASPPSPRKTPSQSSPGRTPEITINSPATPESPGSFHSAHGRDSPEQQFVKNSNAEPSVVKLGPDGLPLVPDSDNPLFLVEGQSFMAWDVKHTLLPMASKVPRTPGLHGPDGNPLSRPVSYVSQLSSEFASSAEEEAASEEEDKHAVDTTGRYHTNTGKDDEDLKCNNCKNETFRTTMSEHGQKLRCKKCGLVL